MEQAPRPQSFAEAIAAEIRAEMARQKLKFVSLAAFMDWNAASLSRVINDPDSLDLGRLEQIGMFLGISPAELAARAVQK